MKFISLGPNDSAEYDNIIKTMPAFVKIYSPTCPHCVNMQEAWDALKNKEAIQKYNIAIIEIHAEACDNIKSLSGKINLGLPTIRAVHKDGLKWVEYNSGNRTTENMANFIKKQFSNTATTNTRRKTKKQSRKQSRKTYKKQTRKQTKKQTRKHKTQIRKCIRKCSK